MALEPREPRAWYWIVSSYLVESAGWPAKGAGMWAKLVLGTNLALVLAFPFLGSGAKLAGVLMPLDLTLSQAIVAAGLLVSFVVMLVVTHARRQMESERSLFAALATSFCVGRSQFHEDPGWPEDEIACISVRNKSTVKEIKGVEAQIASDEPSRAYRPSAYLQWLESSQEHRSVILNAGATGWVQIARVCRDANGTYVRPTYRVQAPLDRLTPGEYRVLIDITGEGTRGVRQAVILTVTDDLVDPLAVELDGPSILL